MINKYNLFNDGWQFSLSENLSYQEFLQTNIEWEDVEIPHDWSIYFDFNMKSLARNEGGLLDGGYAFYQKKFSFSKDYAGKIVLLRFGGIYMNSSIWVNDSFVGNYPFGYLDQDYDITDLLVDGENKIVVKVEHRQPSSRWYSGSGIYRNVHLVVKNKLSFIEDEILIRHERFEGNDVNSSISVMVENRDKEAQNFEINHKVYFMNEDLVAEFSDIHDISAGEKRNIETNINLSDVKLWDIDSPNLYYLKSSILKNGEEIDSVITRYGYRKIDWDSQEGFYLNDRYIKLHGVCMHHDNGALGSIQDTESERRKILKLKSMGVNSIRTSHNPQSREFIRLCDELGVLVIEEAFDTWHGNSKKEYDYNRFFHRISTLDKNLEMTWAEYDLAKMVKRDINSPSIIMWSIGNEIWETKQEHGIKQAKLLIDTIKKYDNSRYVTIGENGFNMGYSEGIHNEISNMVDAVGLNYAEKAIDSIIKERPHWKFYGAETSSAVKSRGVYYGPKTKDNIATGSPYKKDRNYQMSDYGNDRVGWGETAINSWIPDRDNKAYAGQFIWTGFDYIGEPTPWHNEENLGAPSKSSYFGIFDTCGIPKMDYYFYQSQWIDKKEKAIVKILPHWNFEDKKLLKELGTDLKLEEDKVAVRVYSNLKNVELFLNEKSLGKKSFNEKYTNYGRKYLEGKDKDELYLEWIVDFEPGNLKAKAYEDSLEVYDEVSTASEAYEVKLSLDSEAISNKSTFIRFDILDEFGNIVPTAGNEVQFSAAGAEILGVDNGNALSHERYKAYSNGEFKRRAFSGSGLIIVKPRDKDFEIEAKSNGLKSAKLKLESKSYENNFEDKLKGEIKLKECSSENNEEVKEDNHEFIVAKNISLTKIKNAVPLFPLETEVYSISGEKKEEKFVEFKKLDELHYKGITESGLESSINIRESEEVLDSYNYALAWNGSEIPAAFASYSNEDNESEDSILSINNGITSWDVWNKDRWTNISETKRDEDYVGILFGRAGKLEKHNIYKVRIAFFEDDETSLPLNYEVKYYTDEEVNVPENYSKIPKDHELNNDTKFEKVNVAKTYSDQRYINIEFEDVSTYAIRIDMKAGDKAIGISEIEIYGKDAVKTEGFDLKILVDGEELSEFSRFNRVYEIFCDHIPNIEVEINNNASVTKIIPTELEDDAIIIINDEADMIEEIYKIRLNKRI